MLKSCLSPLCCRLLAQTTTLPRCPRTVLKMRWIRTPCTIQSSLQQSMSTAPRVRDYPDEPRVGVGVFVFRRPNGSGAAEVMLVQRGKEPNKGKWSPPGGSLELGERITDCAAREVLEETGIRIRSVPSAEAAQEGWGAQLHAPRVFAAVDGIYRDDQGRVKYHYALIEVAAVAEDPSAAAAAADDVDDVKWIPVDSIRSMPDVVAKVADLAEEAVERFKL